MERKEVSAILGVLARHLLPDDINLSKFCAGEAPTVLAYCHLFFWKLGGYGTQSSG